MKGKKLSPIYSQYEINTILFYGMMIMFLPLILVFTYIFDIDSLLDINLFILWSVITNFIFTLIGTVILLVRKDHLKRVVKANYRNEFFFLGLISIFGILGVVVFYDYMGGNRDYIANILVVIFAVLLFALIFLGRKFFKFDYMKKK